MTAAQAKAVAAQENDCEMAQQKKTLEKMLMMRRRNFGENLVEDDEDLEKNAMDAYQQLCRFLRMVLPEPRRRPRMHWKLDYVPGKRLKELKDQGMSDLEAKKQVAKELKAEAQQEIDKLENAFYRVTRRFA